MNYFTLQIQKIDFYKDVYTIFKSDLIDDTDHMHISGTTPSSVVLSQTRLFKIFGSDIKKCQNRLNPKIDGVINPQNNTFTPFQTRNFFNALKSYKSTEVDFRT